MEDKSLNTSVNRAEATSQRDAERTVATPHFDAAAIEQAQQAVPLSQVRTKRAWPTSALLAIAALAGLAGGIIGGILPSIHLKRETVGLNNPSQQKEAQPAKVETAQAPDDSSPSAPAESRSTSAAASAAPDDAVASIETDVARADDSTYAAGARSSVETDDAAQARAGKLSKEDEETLRGALNDWVAATNARDIEKQISFYNPTMNAFYLWRNASRADVRADKERVFERASLIDVRAGEPAITLSTDRQTAIMRFRKRYNIQGVGSLARSGEVLQELRWRRVGQAWRIISERDLRVVR